MAPTDENCRHKIKMWRMIVKAPDILDEWEMMQEVELVKKFYWTKGRMPFSLAELESFRSTGEA